MVNLQLGDCLQLMADIKDNSIDLVLCDPPYQKTAHKWDTCLDLETMWQHYDRICKPNAAIVLMASQPFTTKLISSNLEAFAYTLVWDKGKGSNPLLAKKQPMRSHEDIVIFYHKPPIYNPQMTEGKPYQVPKTGGNRTNSIVGSTADKEGFVQTTDSSKRYPLSILKFSIHCGSKKHPTEKPVDLMRYLIRTYSNQGETILDNCMGSGTTGVACKLENRNFIGIEQDEKYFAIAEERIGH